MYTKLKNELIYMYILFTFIFYLQYINCIYIKVLHTPIISPISYLKLHHLIVLTNDNKNIYTMDFTPINQTDLKTKILLLLNYNVSAEIRIKKIINSNYHDELDIIKKWSTQETSETQIITKKNMKYIHDREIKKIIMKTSNYDSQMNLYTNNCQHFSSALLSDKL